MEKEVYLKIKGRVQGIGFRWWAVKTAEEIGGISGWVHNAADGSVEILMSGEEDNIDRKILACHAGAPQARVEWFHQSANKEARILSNAATVVHTVRFPCDWALRWPELYAHLTTYRWKFRANRWHDAADVVTGLVEREIAGRDTRIKSVKFM